jgi:hypothetical protein
MEDEKRQKRVGTTIQLYNKVRMVSSPRLLEVRVYLKAAAAWMLTAFGGAKPKAALSCIKLHCRSAAELGHHFPADAAAARGCLEQVLALW